MKGKQNLWRRAAALALALALCAAGARPALAAEASAASVALTKTEGTVSITNSQGRELSLRDNMRLYGGYHVKTEEASYAWLNLDSTKLTKLDAVSELELRKSGTKLELLLNEGSLYFNVTEPLTDNESLSIRTATVIVGIRGTSGWVQVVDQWHSLVYVLQGEVECSVTDPVTGQTKTTIIRGGEMAEFVVYDQERPGDKCDIIRRTYTEESARGYILMELVPDEPHRDKIEADSGLVFPDSLEEAQKRLEQDEAEASEALGPILDEYGQQDNEISQNPVWEEDDEEDDEEDTSGDIPWSDPDPDPDPPRPRVVTVTMQVDDVEVDALLARPDVSGVVVASDPSLSTADNTLVVDEGITVPAGKTLTLAAGVPMIIYDGIQFQVDGTAVTAESLTNRYGVVTVTSPNSLRVGGDLLNYGTLTVTATGHVAVDGTLTNSGGLAGIALTYGARVRAKTFNLETPVARWGESLAQDSEGYYVLECLDVSLSVRGTVTDWVSLAPIPGATVTVSVLDENGAETEQLTAQTDDNGAYTITGTVLRGQGYQVSAVAEAGDSADFTFAAQQSEPASADGTAAVMDFELHRETGTWGYYLDGASGRLVIYGSGDMDDYDHDPLTNPPWYDERASIKTVVVDTGIEHIGSFAFDRCTNLTSITIPDSVTSIGEYAFQLCFSLETIGLPDGITTIELGTFYRCNSLTSITIPGSVESIGAEAFMACFSLTSITIPDSVESIGDSAFYDCESLTSITIPAGVESIGDSAFELCSSLTRVEIPSSVTTIGSYAFSQCTSLTSITIPDGVTSIGRRTFDQCTSLTSVTLPNSVESIGEYAFNECSSLTSITIPESVTSIGYSAFFECVALTEVYYTGTEAEWNTLMQNNEAGNDALQNATVVYNAVPVP